jgi:hypothetical protein
MKKELRPVHDNISCDVCGRTMLKGERTEAYLAPDGQRHVVCELCFARAEGAGWIRESAHDDMPTRGPRSESRRPLFSRLRRRRPAAQPNGAEVEAMEQPVAEPAADPEPDVAPAAEQPPPPAAPPARPKDPRHIRGVPTNAEVKVERALELFNRSDHQRTVAGLARTLGAPMVAAAPDAEAPATVTLVVAWELSWYRYVVDLADASEQVLLRDKGDELTELGADTGGWNVAIDAEGRLVQTQEAGG